MVATCHHQSFSFEFNESLVDGWVNVILCIVEYEERHLKLKVTCFFGPQNDVGCFLFLL